MALTGILLSCFLLFHVAGNSLILYSQTAFIAYAEALHALGPLLPTASLLLLTVFLLHVIIGFSLAKDNYQAKGRRYAVRRSAIGPSTWPARIMPFTGGAVLLFLLLHLATLRLSDHAAPISDRVSQILTDPLLALLYAVGIAALGLHIIHGFQSMLQSLGCNHPRWNNLLKGLSWLAFLLITGVFTAIVGAVSLPQLFL